MNFQKDKKNDEFEINFIPLIDVLLVIIIFLGCQYNLCSF